MNFSGKRPAYIGLLLAFSHWVGLVGLLRAQGEKGQNIRTQSNRIVNIDAKRYGFASPTDPAPTPGQIITPITYPEGGSLNQLTLTAGTYRVTNASGMAGADPNFSGWRFNDRDNWVWTFVIVDDTSHKVVLYGEADGLQNSQAGIANESSVRNFASTFTLKSTTTLDFMIRDYYLVDNAGGVALSLLPAGGSPASSKIVTSGSAPGGDLTKGP